MYYKKAYDTTDAMILFSASLYLIGNVVACVGLYPISKILGLRNLILVASGLMIVGTLMRTGIDYYFSIILIGQFLNGVAGCFITNSQMQFCYNWFHPKTRGLYISLSNVLNIFGGGIGTLLPLIVIDSTSTDPLQIKREVRLYLQIVFGVTLTLGTIVFIYFQEKPPAGYGLPN